MARAEWKDMPKKPITPDVGMLFFSGLGEYVESDYIYEKIEAWCGDNLENGEEIPEKDWPSYFKISLCEQFPPRYWDLSDVFDDYIGFDKYENKCDPPDGWEEIEKTVNDWIQKSVWCWKESEFAWDGTYQGFDKEEVA